MKTMQKMNYFLWGWLLLMPLQILFAQSVSDSELLFPQNGISLPLNLDPNESQSIEKQILVRIQLEKLPTRLEWQKFQSEGIQLLAYEGGMIYTALLDINAIGNRLASFGIKEISQVQKIQRQVIDGAYNKIPTNTLGQYQLAITFLPTLNAEAIQNLLAPYKVDVQMELTGNLMIIQLAPEHLDAISQMPQVISVQPADLEMEAFNFESHLSQQLYPLKYGDTALCGEGLVIGIGENGLPGEHIDLQNRLETEMSTTNISDHAAHVAGTLAGAGNLNEKTEGIASKAELLMAKNLDIITKVEDWHTDNRMVLTNNSYGPQYNCEKAGEMDAFSSILDEHIIDYPNLLHVFAAGNSGHLSCGSYPDGYRTVLHSSASAKNVLTVGNMKLDGRLAHNSSRGPVADGRIKPEVCAKGSKTYSMGTQYNYDTKSGTSMATPVVTGILALMYERFRESNNNTDPNSALMKALLCNTADDQGNKGPDFSFGFGQVNARRAINSLEQKWYWEDNIAQDEKRNFTIEVPANTAGLKVMLYWHDQPNTALNDKTLINDLDLKVLSPAGTVLPWVLDSDPAKVEIPAIRGLDHTNNIEQVTIDWPAQGSYTFEIQGFELPFGPQDFVVVYELILPELFIQYPNHNSSLIPGSAQWIVWDKHLQTDAPIELTYSLDGGQNWETMANLEKANERMYEWTVPNEFSTQAMIRLALQDGSQLSAQTEAFTIMDTVKQFKVAWDCDGIMTATWEDHPQAEAYELFKLGEQAMESYKIVNDNAVLCAFEPGFFQMFYHPHLAHGQPTNGLHWAAWQHC
ncbi:MAG: S8 family serine peptidase, partial [Bacteroidota bacterium]